MEKIVTMSMIEIVIGIGIGIVTAMEGRDLGVAGTGTGWMPFAP